MRLGEPNRAGGEPLMSRRKFARLSALLAAGAGAAFTNEFALAQGLSSLRNLPPDAVLLNANENPLGPCDEALEAIRAVVPLGGRYGYQRTFEFMKLIAELEGLPQDHVMPFAGSSDALHRVVLSFASSDRSFVTCDPGYEAGERAAKAIGANVIRVPLKSDYSHDIEAMVKADPNAGLIYICNPNNPTGSITRKEEIDYAIANKPPGTIVLLDEAYIHFSKTAEPGTAHVKADKDVIILRTFSKLYGMAGLRAGAAFGRPDLLERLKIYAAGALPVTGIAGAIASLKAGGVVEKRREINTAGREAIVEWLEKKGFKTTPSESNCFMVDVGRPGKDVFEAMLKEKVAVGRSWPSAPHWVRVTVGKPDEMAKFQAAFAKVMGV